MLRPQICYYHIHACALHVVRTLVCGCNVIMGLASCVHDLITGSLNHDLLTLFLYKGPCLCNVFLQRQIGSIIHNGGKTAQIAFTKLGIQIVLDVIQMKQKIHVLIIAALSHQNLRIRLKQLKPCLPVPAVSVIPGLGAVLILDCNRQSHRHTTKMVVLCKLTGSGNNGFRSGQIFRTEAGNHPSLFCRLLIYI